MEIKDGGILIIAAPRVGGTNLMKSIGSYYNKKTRMEYDIVRKYPKYNPNEDVLKYVPIWEKTIESIMDAKIYENILKSAKEFQTIILLDRKDKIKQAESYYVLKTYNAGKVDKKWGDECSINHDATYSFHEYYINSFPEFFERLSYDLNIPIDYYEDVYKNKSLTNKNIKFDLEYFKPKYKLRQPSMDKKIL